MKLTRVILHFDKLASVAIQKEGSPLLLSAPAGVTKEEKMQILSEAMLLQTEIFNQAAEAIAERILKEAQFAINRRRRNGA